MLTNTVVIQKSNSIHKLQSGLRCKRRFIDGLCLISLVHSKYTAANLSTNLSEM